MIGRGQSSAGTFPKPQGGRTKYGLYGVCLLETGLNNTDGCAFAARLQFCLVEAERATAAAGPANTHAASMIAVVVSGGER